MLEHLAGRGVRLADAFAEKAVIDANTAWMTPDCHVDPGIPFAAMARVVRQTVALIAKLQKDQRRADTAESARRDPDRRARQTRRRTLIKGAVTEVIKDTADPADTERLLRDLEEKLHDAEADEHFDDGPIAQVVAKICKALGVSIDLSLFEDEDDDPDQDHTAADGPATPPPPPPGPRRPQTLAEPRHPGLSRHTPVADRTDKRDAPRRPPSPSPD